MGSGAVKVFCQSREKSLPPAHSVYEVRHQRMLLRFGRCCDICGPVSPPQRSAVKKMLGVGAYCNPEH